MHLALFISTILCVLATALSGGWIILQILTALSLCWLSIAAHNFFHQRDNWQMYTFNLTMMSFYHWRISHALSHHFYPNSLHDLEMSLFEPFLCWIPSLRYAPKWRRYLSFVLQPITYAFIFPIQYISK